MIRATLETLLAALLVACAVVSVLYSPKAVLSIATLSPEWRLELLGPQVARVPFAIRAMGGGWFMLATAWLLVRNAEMRVLIAGTCMLSAAAIAGYWLTSPSGFL